MLKHFGAAVVVLVIFAKISSELPDNIVHDLKFNDEFESKKKLTAVDMDGNYLNTDIEQEKYPSPVGGSSEPQTAKPLPLFLMPDKILCLGVIKDIPKKLKCAGRYENISPSKDTYCSKSHYAQIDNETLCLAPKSAKNLKFSKDIVSKIYRCEAEGPFPVICYYPKPSKSIDVKLPNPDLPCLKAKCENCFLQGKAVKDSETLLYLI